MEKNITTKSRAAYVRLDNISKIRKCSDHQSAEQLIYALMHIHIDYCIALLTGLPKYVIKKLHMLQNTATRALCRVGKNEHITPTLKRLSWLPVEFRIKYTVCLLTFNALLGHGPEYTTHMFVTGDTPHGLRSRDALTLNVQRTKQKTLGDRAFKVSAPKFWNTLPKDLRSVNNVKVFKTKLKTQYFLP